VPPRRATTVLMDEGRTAARHVYLSRPRRFAGIPPSAATGQAYKSLPTSQRPPGHYVPCIY